MYFDDPAPAYAATKEPVGSFLILVSALLVSPLGYLTIQPLGQAATTAARALFQV
jgi:NADH-quinone oxidoreductase subunit N